jgi:hypothetical protein
MTLSDGNKCSDYPQPKRVPPSSKTFSSVQEMLDDINPELAEEFRTHAKRPTVRLRKWWSLFRIRRTREQPPQRTLYEVADADETGAMFRWVWAEQVESHEESGWVATGRTREMSLR